MLVNKTRKKKSFLLTIACTIFINIFFLSIFLNFNLLYLDNQRKIDETTLSTIKPSIYLDWNTTFSGLETDDAYDVISDSYGSVYITGRISTGMANEDLILQKYYNNGTLEWEKIIDGVISNNDAGYALALDSNDNIYVAGKIFNLTGFNELLVLKYNSSGDLYWRYNWTGPNSAIGTGIAIDRNDNVYVLGQYVASGTQMLLLRLNSITGQKIWETSYDVDNSVYAGGICTDLNGDIIITGYNNSGSATDLQIAKYNSSGDQQWNESRSINTYDYAYGIAANSNNDIFISGASASSGKHAALIRYNAAGIYQGIQYPLGSSHESAVYDISIDNSTNEIYLTGYNSSQPNWDIVTIKCDNNGVYQWNLTWDGEGYNDYGRGIYYDGTNNIYIAGSTENASYYNGVLIKYSLTPAPFTISTSYYENPDADGTFNITWNPVIGADNFTIYNHTSYITEINDSLQVQHNGQEITGTSFNISGLEDGYYYYIIESHNTYGNSTSNCLSIKVVHDPSSVTIYSNHSDPSDDDGLFWLNWTNAKYVDDYTIYWSTSAINDTNLYEATVLTTLADNKSYIDISSFNNGKYYFVVRAHNIFDGDHAYTLSNNINLTLGIPPGIITINALQYGNPDLTGEFMINWGYVKHAENYTIFWRKDLPININSGIIDNSSSDVFAVEFGIGITTWNHSITDWSEGTFYFVVFAFNLYGNSSSSNLQIDVDYPGGATSSDGLPWWLYPIITGAISAVVGIVIKQSYSSVKKRRIFMQKVQDKFDQIDNIEAFLKEKLDYQEWQKLQEPLDKYKRRQITNKDLIKMGKKELGKDFTDIFIGKKKPKT